MAMFRFQGRGVKRPTARANPVGDSICIYLDDAENPEAWWSVSIDAGSLACLLCALQASRSFEKLNGSVEAVAELIEKWCTEAVSIEQPG